MRVFFLIILIISLTAPSHADIYSSWGDIMEPDKCATAWLIKRYVDKEAVFKFYDNGTFAMDGTAFDVPTAELRPSRSMSTFELVIKKYKLDDPAVLALAKVIRDIEINKWDKRTTAEAEGVVTMIRGLNAMVASPDARLRQSFVLFDALHAGFEDKLKGGRK